MTSFVVVVVVLSLDAPTKEGDTFVGHVVFDHCSQRKPENMSFTITGTKEDKSFTPILKVRMHTIPLSLKYVSLLYPSTCSVRHYFITLLGVGDLTLSFDESEWLCVMLVAYVSISTMDPTVGYIVDELLTQHYVPP